MSLGIIIQARLGSQRLPGKIIAPIAGDRSILDIVILRLKKMGMEAPIILATGDPVKNAALAPIAGKNEVHFFSGSEDDVLQRFIDCARQFRLKKVLRVCADNPFLDIDLGKDLLTRFTGQDYDYASFSVDQKPTILTHYGFFSELVDTDALIRAHEATGDKFDREHVTRYLYNNPGKFSIKLEEAPVEIKNEKKVRLTVDTKADFTIASLILEQLLTIHSKFDYNYKDVLSVLKKMSPEILEGMQEQIIENSKS